MASSLATGQDLRSPWFETCLEGWATFIRFFDLRFCTLAFAVPWFLEALEIDTLLWIVAVKFCCCGLEIWATEQVGLSETELWRQTRIVGLAFWMSDTGVFATFKRLVLCKYDVELGVICKLVFELWEEFLLMFELRPKSNTRMVKNSFKICYKL